jgi:tRNA/rRNA methyltransferase
MQSGNLGSAARALKNMGFDDLRLVAPAASRRSRAATSMAVHAADVLANATIHPNLASALGDRTLTIGTTCRPGLYRSGAVSLREAAQELIVEAGANPIAMIFGPEDHGLTNDELKLCQRLITIPTAEDYPSLNLAQAVMVVAYELKLAASGTRPASTALEFAPSTQVEAMLTRLSDALIEIGFLPDDNPDHIMFALRGLFGRSGLTIRELDILNGMARQMKWTAHGGAVTLQKKRAAGRKLR